MLTKLQKSPNSFDSFEKDSSSGSDGTTQVGTRQLGRISWRIDSLQPRPPSSERWISVAQEVTVRLIPPWPSFRRQPEILETSPHIPRCLSRGPRMARPLTKKSGRNKKAASLRLQASPERLHPKRRCLCPQHSQYVLQGPEPSHLFQKWREESLRNKVSQAKEEQKHLRRLVVLVTSALMRLTWTVPWRLLSNEFRASGLPPSEKKLCWLYLTQEVRLMPYTLPLLRNWASELGQLRKIPWWSILGG